MIKMDDFISKLQLNQLPLVIDEVEYLGLWGVVVARRTRARAHRHTHIYRERGLGVIIVIRITPAPMAMRSNSCWVYFTIMVRFTNPEILYCNVK